MFLQDIQEVGVPDLDYIEGNQFNKRHRYRQKLREDLRRRFRSEYLGQLSRTKNSKGNTRTVREGEIVFVGHDNRKRLDWPLVQVIQVIQGRDGAVRVARLKTASGELVRPVQRLYPLEITSPVVTDILNKTANEIKDSSNETVPVPETTNTLPLSEKNLRIPNENSSPEENLENPVDPASLKMKEVKSETRTRSGRRVNAPKGFDL